MKTFEIQRDLLKKAIKNTTSNWGTDVWVDDYSEKKYAIFLDGFHVNLINKDDFYLNYDKFKHLNSRQIVKPNEYFLIDGFDDGVRIIEKEDKRTLIEIKNEDKEDKVAYIDEKLLKHFESPTFQICKENSNRNPVFIYENEELVGMVLPVRRNK